MSLRMLSHRVVLGLALSAVPCVSFAVDRATVVQSLSAYEREPAVATVQAWGADGERLLREVAVDANALPFVRARAAHMLRLWTSSPRAHETVRTLAADATAPRSVRRAAMTALVEGFHDVTEVTRYLSDPDVFARDAAVWSLSASDLPQARQALQTAMTHETAEAIRTGITSALRRIDARVRPAANPATVNPATPIAAARPAAR